MVHLSPDPGSSEDVSHWFCAELFECRNIIIHVNRLTAGSKKKALKPLL